MANKQYTLGRGRIYFDAFLSNSKTKTGERYFGNTSAFSLTIESQTLDHFDSDSGIRVKDDSVLLELNRTGSFTTDNIDPENVALFLLGTSSVLAQASGSVVDEAIANVKPDRYYQIGATTVLPAGVRDVSAVTVKVGATTKTLGTDYTVDLTLARVYIVPGGTILADDDILVSYTKTAKSRVQIITAANATIDGALRFEATNPKGTLLDYYFPYVRLSPNGEYALKGDEWQQISFNLDVQKLDDTTEAIYVDGRPYTP
jgi:hypothetical protein